ncbi:MULTISPECIES: cold shock domain-containing protein [unclassified Xanthobacter]|uniref:cold shock domain-containing protein n=1 Tax=unclassified Xanthobacter TaxID=2623496 RepID=UPI001F26BE04|nr:MULTISPECIES: cold shock domain-containing protein [unclassified Xanthobacter]
MAEGAAKWFSAWNGFGFITPDAVGNDALIHISAVERMGVGDPRESQKFSVDLMTNSKSGKFSAGPDELLGSGSFGAGRLL